MAEDDLLNPDEIEALLRASGAGAPSSPPVSKPKPPAPKPSPAASMGGGGGMPSGAAQSIISQAEADLAAALSPGMNSPHLKKGAEGTSPFNFQEFNRGGVGAAKPSLELQALQEVELDLRIELGRTELLVEEVLELKSGSVVPLDKLAGDPVDVLVNGRLIARGEVLVLNDNFCVRIAEILTPDD